MGLGIPRLQQKTPLLSTHFLDCSSPLKREFFVFKIANILHWTNSRRKREKKLRLIAS